MRKKTIAFLLAVTLAMIHSFSANAYELASSSNATEIITVNEDSSIDIHYEEKINDVKSEELDNVVDTKTKEQEQKKEDIESENGYYNYSIDSEEVINHTEITVPVEDYKKAEELAAERNGEIITKETVVETTVSEVFDSLEAAQAYIDEIGEKHTIIEAVINVTPEQIISGLTAQQVEENGYHVVETENGFDIIITGGLEEINIDLAGLSAILEPGDSISATFNIINESGDKYEIKEYSKSAEGPYRYIRTSSFKEEMGIPAGTLLDGIYTYYIPNDVVKLHGKSHLATPADEVVKWYNKKNNTSLSYSEIRNTINDDLLLEYYNEILGKEYDSLYEAWVENFNSRLWTTTYNELDGEQFFSTIDFDSDVITFDFKATIDGPATDNMYQSTVWGYIENIVLKIVDTIIPASYESVVTYQDKEYSYSVTYDEEESSYTIEIVGDGYIPSVEVTVPTEEEKTPEIEPVTPPVEKEEDPIEENVTPEIEVPKKSSPETETETTKVPVVEIDDTPVPQASAPQPMVLGASRPKEGAVLGVSRPYSPQTGDFSVDYYYIILMIVSLIVLYIVCKRQD